MNFFKTIVVPNDLFQKNAEFGSFKKLVSPTELLSYWALLSGYGNSLN